MKAVLASLKPFWYYLVGEGIKTAEVRKTFPKADDWGKDTFFYMSRDEKSFAKIPREFQEKYRKHFGKVGLRFVCDFVFPIWDGYKGNLGDDCLTYEERESYLNGEMGYGWHITDLVIYDEPRELGDFKRWVDRSKGQRYHEDMLYLQRPPQSWCYVEEGKR